MSVITFTALDKDKIEIAQGTGFLVGKGILATNYHLLSQANSAEGRNYKGKKVKFEGIISVNKNLDLALVKVKSKEPALTLRSSEGLVYGKELFVIGGNDVGELAAISGKVLQILEFETAKKIIDTTLNATDTFSGSPVLDAEGKVVGILVFLDTRKHFVIPADHLDLLSKSGAVTKFKKQEPIEYLKSFEGINLAGKVFAALKDTGRAEKYLKKIVQQKPDDMSAQLLLAEVYTSQRNYSSAVISYRNILIAQPDRDDILITLGNVYIKKRDWKEAIASLEKAIQMNSENNSAHYNIGNAYFELRDFTKAVESYNQFLATSPRDPKEAHVRLGESLFETEQFNEAAAAYQEALKLTPQEIPIHYKLAQSLQKGKQYDKAAETLYHLAELSPEDASTYYNNVVIMYDQANLPQKASEAAFKMTELKPEDSDAQYNLGFMLVKLKKYPEAIEAFEKAVAIRPDFEYAMMQIGYCYNQLKDYKQSIAAYEKLVQINPESDNGWLNIAIGYMLQKKWAKALPALQKTIELKPNSGNPYYNLAICYLNLKDNYSARDVYMKLKKIDAPLAQRLLKYFK